MRKCFVTLTAILFCLSVVTHADDTFNKLFGSGKYKDAIEYADQKLPATSRNADIWVKLGKANEEIGLTEKALACYMVSSRMNPNDYGSLYGAARIYNKLDQPETAMEMAKKALEQNFTGEASWEFARASIALKRPADAKKALEKVIETDPANVVANRELGHIYFEDKQYQEAIPLLKKAYDEKPDGDVAYKIGKCYLATRNAGSAVEFLKKAIEKKPSLHAAGLDLARAYYDMGKYLAAASEYDRITGKIKFDAADYYQQGVAFEKAGKMDDAVRGYRQAIKMFGSSKKDEALAAREKVGRYDLDKKKYSAALTQLNFLKGADPSAKAVPDLYFLLADAYMGAKNSQQAIASLEKAISLDKDNVEAYARLADLYAKNNMQTKAKVTYEKLMSLRPDDPSVYLILGEYNLKAKRYSEALNQFVKSNSLKKSKEALEGIALSAKALKQWPKAKDAAESAVAMDNSLLPSRIVLYEATMRDNSYSEAQKHLEVLITKDPNNKMYWKDLATCYDKTGNTSKLAEADKKLISLDKKNSVSRRRFAEYSLKNGDKKTAYSLYKELSFLTPKDAAVFKNLYELAIDSGDKTAAVGYLKKYLALNPNDAESQKNLGDLLYEKKQLDGALAAYRMAIKVDPTIKGFYKRYAEIVIAKGQTDEVIKALTGVVKSGEADVGTYETLGQIYQNKKHYKSAIANYQKALTMEPQNTEALVSLASCQAATGDVSGAVISYEQAVMMNPKAKDEYKALGDLYTRQKKNEQAIRAYRKFLDAGGKSQDVAEKIGKDAYNKKQYNEAAKYLGMVTGTAANDFYHSMMLSESYFHSDKHNEAISIAKGLIARNPKTATRKSLTKMVAESYEKLGKTSAAIAYYNKYLALGAYDADVAFKRAYLEEKNNQITNATKHYLENTSKYPKDHRNFLQLGLMYSKSKSTLSKAAGMLKKATAAGSTDPKLWLEVADVYNKLGREKDELEALKKYIEKDPQNVAANVRIGKILMDNDKTREGMVFLETANTLSPNKIEIMVPLATGYIRTKRTGEAADLLEKAKEMKPDDASVRRTLYKVYKLEGDSRKALNEIEELLKLKRDNETLLLYAKLLLEGGKAKDAENAIEDIRATDPENIDALMTLGMIQRERKKYDDAIETYKEAVYIDAGYAPAIFERAEVYMLQNKPQWAQKFYERAIRADPSFGLAELGLAKIAMIRKDKAGYAAHVKKAYTLDPKNPLIKEAYQGLK